MGPVLLVLIAVFGVGWRISNTFRDKIDDLWKDVGREFREVRSDMHAMENRLSERIGAVEHRMGRLEERVGAVEHRMGRLEERVGAVEHRMGRIEVRIDHMGRPAKTPETEERELVPA